MERGTIRMTAVTPESLFSEVGAGDVQSVRSQTQETP